MQKRRGAKKSVLMRIDPKMAVLINNIKKEAREKYSLKLNDRQASEVLFRSIKKNERL